MKFFIVQTIAVTVFFLTNRMVPANGGQSLADLLRSLIQDEESAQFMKTAIVESIDGRAQSFSLNIVGCDTISSTVRSKLSEYLEEVFPGRGITISCAAGVLSGGVTYTRWGHNACPSVSGTEMLYIGRMAGVLRNQRGGGANFLCLPNDPEYNTLNTYSQYYYSKIYGTEYEVPIAGSHNHNVPCAVCHATTRAAKVMIPAKTSCAPNWTREYYGYLQSEGHFGDRPRTEFVCVDKDQVPLAGSHANIDGALLYHVKAACHGIQCPPYNANEALTCTVCTY